MKTEPSWLKFAALTVLLAVKWHAITQEVGSPHALSERVKIRPGIAVDHIDRCLPLMSPKRMQQQTVRMSGTTPDRIDRGPMTKPPKLDVPSSSSHGPTHCPPVDRKRAGDPVSPAVGR